MRFKQINPVANRHKYRQYPPTRLTNAYKSVEKYGISGLKAFKIYMVPEITPRDRVLGKIDPETTVMGKVPLFSQYG
ncbi:hypothetical protein KUTeg_020345 [Tegillarca granosa]|uniref:Uncharacterized protein n=1 Tax=Tegillarca granosa TaxID=220873 RepID=A0ABQ9E7L5_TEGGR|nr:hypothetical protein KUTeg_020345 [Tegillarca granosa]